MGQIDDLITTISNSQQSERNLIAQLNTLSSQPGFNVNNSGVPALIDSINNLSSSRVAMLKSLNSQANIMQVGVNNSRADLVGQITLLNVVQDQLDKANQIIANIRYKNDTKSRMVEVNTYYGKRYEAQSRLMKMLILICVPLLIFFILKKKGILPPMISNYVIGITIAVGALFLIRAMWDITTRSNMNYDEFDWEYEDPSTYSPTIMEYNKKHLNLDSPLKNLIGNLGLCVGSSCCDNGMTYDKATQKCTNIKGKTAEGFVCGSKLQATNVVDVDEEEEKQNGISPFSYDSNYASLV